MAQIFISYKREDRPRAKVLATALIAKGYDVWWDVDLLPGQDFYDEIAGVIKKAKATIVLWSDKAVESRPVRSEASLADSIGTLIPARLDPIMPPLPFNARHTIELSGWNGEEDNSEYRSLMQAIALKVGPPSRKQKPETVVESEIEAAEDTWKILWSSVRDLQPESVAEYKHFVDKYADHADHEIIAFANRRVAHLSKKKPIDNMRWLVGAAVSGVILVAAFAQINMWQDTKAESLAVKKSDPIIVQAVSPAKDNSADDAAFNQAQNDGRVSAFGGYAKAYPDGQHISSSDQGAWDSASRQGTSQAYKAYQKHFPKGKFLAQAQKKIEDLEKPKKIQLSASEKLRISCEAGKAADCNLLGYNYANGKGLRQDDTQARIYYTKACDQGNSNACGHLGNMYRYGKGGIKDETKARAIYEQGCDLGSMESCHNLGDMFRNGAGGTKKEVQARALFKKACDGGIPAGCGTLGFMYDVGAGGVKDNGIALTLYKNACQKEDAASCFNAGTFYELGKIVALDVSTAKTYYGKACGLGHEISCKRLTTLP